MMAMTEVHNDDTDDDREEPGGAGRPLGVAVIPVLPDDAALPAPDVRPRCTRRGIGNFHSLSERLPGLVSLPTHPKELVRHRNREEPRRTAAATPAAGPPAGW